MSANLHQRLAHVAGELSDKAWDKGANADELREFLRDHAQSLADFAHEAETQYAHLDTDGDVPTNAQGIALARLLRSRFADRTAAAAITRGTHGLPDDYLHVTFLGDGYEGGIDREGRTGT